MLTLSPHGHRTTPKQPSRAACNRCFSAVPPHVEVGMPIDCRRQERSKLCGKSASRRLAGLCTDIARKCDNVKSEMLTHSHHPHPSRELHSHYCRVSHVPNPSGSSRSPQTRIYPLDWSSPAGFEPEMPREVTVVPARDARWPITHCATSRHHDAACKRVLIAPHSGGSH